MTQESDDRVLGRIEAKLEALIKSVDGFSADIKQKVQRNTEDIVKLKLWQSRWAGGAAVAGVLIGYIIDKIGL